jgi:hypothetical protein
MSIEERTCLMDDHLFEDFLYSFLLKPLLFAGKALEYHGLRTGNDYELLLPRDEFRSLWRQFPDQRSISPTGHRVLQIPPFEFYEHLFGYDYLLLTREAIDRGDYLVMPVEMLTFFTIIRIMHEQENTQAKQDLVVLMQKLGVWPLTPASEPMAPQRADLQTNDEAKLSEDL